MAAMWVDLLGGVFLTMGLWHPRYMNWVFGVHSLLWDTLLSLDTMERGLVLPQLCWLPKGSPYSSEDWVRVGWGIGGGQDYGSEGELGLVCKIIIFIKKQYQPVKSFKEYVLENNWGDSLLRNQSKDQSIKDYSDWNNYTGESMECEYKN